MSSERTQPPSIAPKKAPASRSAGLPGDDAAETRTGNGQVNGGAAPSMGERLRRGAESLRGAVTGGDSRADSADEATSTGSAVSGAGRDSVRAGSARSGSPRPGAARADSPRPTTSASPGGARKVRLAVARIDPWSVMKLSFLLSVAIGIMIVVSAAVVWQTLDNLAVFTSVNDTIATIADDPDFFNVLEYAAFPRVISLATMIAVVDVVLLTALSTIGAFLYNIVAALVGGITVTLTDD